MKTLVFATAFSNTKERWERRFGKWLKGIEESGIEYDQILLPDDGSAVFPDCFDYDIIYSPTANSTKPVTLLSHTPNLGRPANLDYPGWYRSFAAAVAYAKHHGFDKVVHIESDCFVYSPRLAASINAQTDRWRAMWCPRYHFPETAIQVIAGSEAIDRAHGQLSQDYSRWVNQCAEHWMAIDWVDRSFNGDRYGEYLDCVPEDADYATQIDESWATSRTKFVDS